MPLPSLIADVPDTSKHTDALMQHGYVPADDPTAEED